MSHPKVQLEALGIRALKRLSQNFLTSPHWAEKLVDAAVIDGVDEIWEVGPGLGALTEVLVDKARCPIRIFEIDRTLGPHLAKKFPQLTLVQGDFLKADFESSNAQKISLLSNLPYHISSPMIFRVLDLGPRLLKMVLTFQKEFADRLTATAGTENYGGLSVMAQFHYEMEDLGIIPPGAFFPKPDVSTRAIAFFPRHREASLAEPLRLIVKTAFAHRRKRLMKNLRTGLPQIPPEALEKALQEPDLRPESLSLEDYLELTKALSPYLVFSR